MKTQTSYTKPGTCAAPTRGRGLQGWVAKREWIDVEKGIWGDVKGDLKGGVIRPNWVYNNTFGGHINELGAILRDRQTASSLVTFEN